MILFITDFDQARILKDRVVASLKVRKLTQIPLETINNLFSSLSLKQSLSILQIYLLIYSYFQGILKENKFTSEFLTKLVAITLFLLWHIRTGGGDDLEEFDCIGKDEEVYRMILLDMPYTQNSVSWLVC